MSRTKSPFFERLVPPGYIFEWAPVAGGPDLSTPEKVAAYFGFGIWAACGAGRMTLGADAAHAVGSGGGEETHTLGQSELPKIVGQLYYWSGRNLDGLYQPDTDGSVAGFTNTGGTLPIPNAGGGQPHNNMPPYIAVYRWQRIV